MSLAWCPHEVVQYLRMQTYAGSAHIILRQLLLYMQYTVTTSTAAAHTASLEDVNAQPPELPSSILTEMTM